MRLRIFSTRHNYLEEHLYDFSSSTSLRRKYLVLPSPIVNRLHFLFISTSISHLLKTYSVFKNSLSCLKVIDTVATSFFLCSSFSLVKISRSSLFVNTFNIYVPSFEFPSQLSSFLLPLFSIMFIISLFCSNTVSQNR